MSSGLKKKVNLKKKSSSHTVKLSWPPPMPMIYTNYKSISISQRNAWQFFNNPDLSGIDRRLFKLHFNRLFYLQFNCCRHLLEQGCQSVPWFITVMIDQRFILIVIQQCASTPINGFCWSCLFYEVLKIGNSPHFWISHLYILEFLIILGENS